MQESNDEERRESVKSLPSPAGSTPEIQQPQAKPANEYGQQVDDGKEVNRLLKAKSSKLEEMVLELQSDKTKLQDQLHQKVYELKYRDKSTLRFIQISGGSMRITREQLRALCSQLAIVYSEERHTKLVRHLSTHHSDETDSMIGFEAFYSWLKSRDGRKRGSC